jgi:hypothetical protein
MNVLSIKHTAGLEEATTPHNTGMELLSQDEVTAVDGPPGSVCVNIVQEKLRDEEQNINNT